MVAIFIVLFAIGVRNAGRRMALLRRVRGPAARSKIAAWICVSLIGLLAAAFCKEQVVPLALLAPLLALPMRKRSGSKLRRVNTNIPAALRRRSGRVPVPYWTLIYVLPIAVFALAAHNALHDIDFVEAPWTPALHLEMVGRTLWSYTKIFLFPTVATQHMTTLGAWDSPQIGVALLGWLAAVTWIALLVANWRNRPRRILMLWASLGLFACLNVVPVPTQFASAYRAGVPLFGFAGLAASLMAPDKARGPAFTSDYRFGRNSQVVAVMVAGMVIWCAVVTLEDVPNWHDEYALMRAEVAADPNFSCVAACRPCRL